MTRSKLWITPALGLALLATGCSAAASGEPQTSHDSVQQAADVNVPAVAPGTSQLPVAFTGDDKQNITVKSLERLIVLDDATLQIAHALGQGDAVFATPKDSLFEDLATQAKERITTGGGALTVEGVVSMDPTLVIGSNMRRHADLTTGLREVGVPATLIDTSQPAPDKIRKTAQVLGVAEAGEALARDVQQQIDVAANKAANLADDQRPRVMVLSSSGAGDSGQTTAAGQATPAHEIIEAAGAVNTGAESGLDRYQTITAEGLIAAAPEVIIVAASELEDLGGKDGIWDTVPGLSGAPAAEDRSLVVLDDELIKLSGVATGKAVQTLQSALLPEL